MIRVSTWSRAQSSLMSHSGLSWLASMAGLASEGNGLAKGACCFREKFFFWSFPSLRTFNMLAFSKRERGGMTDSPWPFFFFLAAAGKIYNEMLKKMKELPFIFWKVYIFSRIIVKSIWKYNWRYKYTQLYKRKKKKITGRVHFQSLVLLADVDRGQLRLRNGCGVIHQHHHRVNVDVVVILWRGGRSPYLCCKFARQNAIRKMKITRFTVILKGCLSDSIFRWSDLQAWSLCDHPLLQRHTPVEVHRELMSTKRQRHM